MSFPDCVLVGLFLAVGAAVFAVVRLRRRGGTAVADESDATVAHALDSLSHLPDHLPPGGDGD